MYVKTLTVAEWQSLALLVADKVELGRLREKVMARAKRYQLSICGLFGVGEVKYIGGYDTMVEAERMYDGVSAQCDDNDMLSLVLIDTKLGKILKQSIN